LFGALLSFSLCSTTMPPSPAVVRKAVEVLFALALFLFWGTVFTVFKPLSNRRNTAIKNKAKDLDAQAVRNLGCGARSVYVRLPKNKITLHAVEAGNTHDKLVILLHGFPDCWHCWSSVIPTLVKNGYLVVAPDLRGYNLSDKPAGVASYSVDVVASDINDLVTYYNKKSAIVVGHDWGGVAAWTFAQSYPEVIEKLVVLNASHPLVFQRVISTYPLQALSSWYMLFFQLPWLPVNLFSFAPYLSVQNFIAAPNKPNLLTQEDKDILASSYAQDGALPAMLSYYKSAVRRIIAAYITGEKPKTEQVTKITAPVLILWGESDIYLIPQLAQSDDVATNSTVQYT